MKYVTIPKFSRPILSYLYNEYTIKVMAISKLVYGIKAVKPNLYNQNKGKSSVGICLKLKFEMLRKT